MSRPPRAKAGAPAAEDGATGPAPAATPLALTALAEADGPHPEMDGYGTRDFYAGALDDERGRVSFIKEVVSQARRCPEMSRYRAYLTDNLDMSSCSVLRGLREEDYAAMGIELHHHPLTLYDVCELVLGAMEAAGLRITTFAVVNRVMAYHWRGMVGLVPLTPSLHEMAHAGLLALDIRSVYGDWPRLLDECSQGITAPMADKLREEAASWSRAEENQQRNQRLLAVAPQRWAAAPPTTASLLRGPNEEEADDGS